MLNPMYLLSDRDKRVLMDALTELRNQSGNTRNVPHVPDVDPQAPELYVAFVPAGGIPAMVQTSTGTSPPPPRPGSANCEVFRVLDGALYDCGFTREVFNLSESVVPSGWALIARDKWGTWLPVAVSGRGSSGTCWVRILCKTTSAGGYPGLVQSYDPVMETYHDVGGHIADVDLDLTPTVGTAGTEITLSTVAGVSVGDRLLFLDGFCGAQTAVVMDVDSATGTVGTDTGTTVTVELVGTSRAEGVSSVVVTSGGSGYASSPPTVSFSGGSGAAGTAVLDVTGDHVVSVTVTAHGSGYAGGAVTFAPPAGTADATATGVIVLSGPVKIYKDPVWVQFNPEEFAPKQNDVDEPVVYFARDEGPFTDGVPVKLAIGGETVVFNCVDGSSTTFYAGRLASHVSA